VKLKYDIMKKIFSIISCFSIIFCNFCIAQEDIKQDVTKNFKDNLQHSLFLEILGSSFQFYNITYDCSYKISQKRKITVGLGGRVSSNYNHSSFGMTPQFNYLNGEKHHLELGVGLGYNWEKYKRSGETDSHVHIPIRIGYRYQKSEGGFFWKIAFVPTFFSELNFRILPWAGVAFGFTF